MVRLEDGKSGIVQEMDGELRIVYSDRRETYVAGKREKWVPAAAPARALLEAEIDQVAHAADRVLRSLVENSPTRWWEPMDPSRPAFDPGLVGVITAHLKARA